MGYVTIKDIAKALNLSVATVSRAFNDRYGIKKETKDLVLKKAKELGYRPNPMALKLLQKKSYNIGVVIPEFIGSFFPEVIIGIQEVLNEKNYQVIIAQSNESADLELENIMNMENQMVDGLILSLSMETKNINYLKDLVESHFPIVLFNRVSDSITADKVVFDDFNWALFATEHLIKQGHRKIYHLAGPDYLSATKNRRYGFEKAMLKHNLDFRKDFIIKTGLTIADGERVLNGLIEDKNIPEAIFATNDHTAIGAIKALKKHGYNIPENISIMGFSESKLSTIIDPPLSSVRQPTHEMGKEIAHLLLEQLSEGENHKIRTIKMPGELIIRTSSGSPRKSSSGV